MHPEEEVQDLGVRQLFGIIEELHRFRICYTAINIYTPQIRDGRITHTASVAIANRAITWMLHITTAVTYTRVEQSLILEVLAEKMLHTPEAAVYS
jgi:hypothetical protein